MLTTSLTDEEYRNNSLFIQININDLYIEHSLKVYKIFDGDLILPIILGVIAHYTISIIAKKFGYNADEVLHYMKNGDYSLLLPCNANSISEYTGIPRETVRRKLKKLKDKGWIRIDDKSSIFLDHSIHNIFDDISLSYARNTIDVACRVIKRINDSNNKKNL